MYVKSSYPGIEKINDTPILGGFILIIFSALPGAFLAFYSIYMYPIDDLSFMITAFLSYVVWNIGLMQFGIKIYLFHIPAWLFWLGLGIFVFVIEYAAIFSSNC